MKDSPSATGSAGRSSSGGPVWLSPGLLLLHNTGGDAGFVHPGLPVQLHIADPDTYQATAAVAAWEQGMTEAGAAVQAFRYPGAGHLFTDPSLPDHDGQAAALAWQRSLSFLGGL